MSGLIPTAFIDDLLSRIDIVEVIDHYVPLKQRGQSYIACCPFHHEKNPSFNVIAKKQFYHCFGCGASGNAISFMMNHLHLGFVEAVEYLAARVGMEVPRNKPKEEQRGSVPLHQLLHQVTAFYQQSLNESADAMRYLTQRQLNKEIIQRYQLGFAPPGWHTLEKQFNPYKKELVTSGMLIEKEQEKTYDRFRQRIMFPIHDRQGRVIGFGARAIDSSQKPKYLNSPETVLFHKNRELYGLYQLIQAQKNIDHILVVEGYMDVIALAQHGILNAVATLGTATSTYHIQLIHKYTKCLYFCFDGDAAGQKAAWRALENALPLLNEGLAIYFVFLPEGQDPDSLVRHQGKDAFLALLKNATIFEQFFLSSLVKTTDNSTLAGKSQLVQTIKPYLDKIGEGPYKELIINELSRLTRLDTHRLTSLLSLAPQEAVVVPQHSIARTPTRLAIALLLQNPTLYSSCSSWLHPDLLQGKSFELIKKLIALIKQNPLITTAGLIEHWRHSPSFDALHKLATWPHQVPQDAIQKEFSDIIIFLVKQEQEKKIQELLEKARNRGLTKEEQLHLQAVLKKRHQSIMKENADE